jgi:hypothetical protein
VLRNLLVLRAPEGGGSAAVTSPGSTGMSIQLRVTDSQSQKLIWIQKNGVGDGAGYYLILRPPTGSLDSSNTIQNSRQMEFDGPGRRP